MTITNPAGVRRLIVGLWSRVYDSRQVGGDTTLAEAKAYVEAAHLGLSALGCGVPPAPFGLHLMVQEALVAAGPKPAATTPHTLGVWRQHLTDDLFARLSA